MQKQSRIIDAIYEAVDLINAEGREGQHIEKAKEAVLFGKGGKLDSLGLVNLIVAVEENIENNFNKGIVLANERAMSMKNSPFHTIGSLAEYISELLEDEIDA